MNVILLERIGNLGKLGETVQVKSGYGRNFLIPQGKAVVANPKNTAKFEERRAELEKVEAANLSAAKERAAQLDDIKVIIRSKSGDEGKLFGSIGTRDIADALSASGIEVDRSEVNLPDGVIRSLGDYDIAIQVHHDVTSTIHLSVIDENVDDSYVSEEEEQGEDA
jgi:large subunit ribosomal protein L9